MTAGIGALSCTVLLHMYLSYLNPNMRTPFEYLKGKGGPWPTVDHGT